MCRNQIFASGTFYIHSTLSLHKFNCVIIGRMAQMMRHIGPHGVILTLNIGRGKILVCNSLVVSGVNFHATVDISISDGRLSCYNCLSLLFLNYSKFYVNIMH